MLMTNLVPSFFQDYAAALMTFSAENIAKYYQTPMAVYSNDGVFTVDKMEDVVSFWERGVKPYAAQKITRATPTVISEEQVAEKLYLCKVSWNNADETGREVSQETNYYILSKNPEGLKISGLLLMAS